MWRNLTQKNNYVQVTKDGIIPFNNIKDICTTNTIRQGYAVSAIFVTEDNKIYWAGSDSEHLFQIYKEIYKQQE